MEQCSFAWSKASDDISGTVLKNVSLNVKPGSLVGVVGFVGSGKSSLLAGILGDMHRLQGSVTCTVGDVGFYWRIKKLVKAGPPTDRSFVAAAMLNSDVA